MYNGVWPTYASMITLELHELNSQPGQFAVRMTYEGAVLNVRLYWLA